MKNVIPFRATTGYDAAEERRENVIGRKIAAARKLRGLTLADFSDYMSGFGVSVGKGGAGKWETGETVPNAYQLVAVCHALGMEDKITALMGDYVPPLNPAGMKKLEEYKKDLILSGRYQPQWKRSVRLIEMSVSSLAVSAGTGEILGEDSFEKVSFPEDKVPAGADFGIRVSGDSMEPVYHDGQIVWVQECEGLSVGQVVVFIYDGEGYLKIYSEQEPEEGLAEDFTDSDGDLRMQPVLESYNPQYPPRFINPNRGFQIVGRVL